MSSFGKNRTKKMMKRETAKKKRAKKTTRATQSDHRAWWFVLASCLESIATTSQDRRRFLSEARAAPLLLLGTNQFKCSDIRKFNLVFLDFAYRVRGAEIPLLAHDFSKRASAVRRPPQDELLGALYRGFFEDERDACEFLRLIED